MHHFKRRRGQVPKTHQSRLAIVLYASSGAMRKERRHLTIRSAPSTTSPSEGTAKNRPNLLPIVVLVLIAIVVIATGVVYGATSTGPTNYACISITHQGANEQIKTTGLLHYLKSQYY